MEYYKKKHFRWSSKFEEILIDLWAENLSDLRGMKRNATVYAKIRAELEKCNVSVTCAEVKNKLHNLSSKYKREKEKFVNDGEVSTWPLYARVHQVIGSFNYINTVECMDDSMQPELLSPSTPNTPELPSENEALSSPLSSFMEDTSAVMDYQENCRTARWNPESTLLLLQAVYEKVRENVDNFERPIAIAFYNEIRAENVDLKQFSWKSMRDKIRSLRLKYKTAIDWRLMKDQGLLKTDEPNSMNDYIRTNCPLFNELDKIFGSRENANVEGVDSKYLIYIKEESEKSFIDYAADEAEEFGEASEMQISNEVPYSFKAARKQLEQNRTKHKSNCNNNSTISYLTSLEKESPAVKKSNLEINKKIEDEKLKHDLRGVEFHEFVEKEKLSIERKKLEIEEKNIEQEAIFKLKELESKERLEILRIEKEFELNKYELEMKYKYNKNE